jgi:hypothetical protein
LAASVPDVETKSKSASPVPIESYRNPSYPKCDHYSDRPRLEQALQLCEERLASVAGRLRDSANKPERAPLVRIYHQMLGIRDQVAECVRRMPLETGDLYTEDHERFEQASAALERVWRRWQTLGG